MKQINLTRGYIAVVDDADFDRVSSLKWHAKIKPTGVYAACWVDGEKRKKLQYMHRMVAGAQDGEQTDHRNGDTLDNRRDNLRICDNRENQHNRVNRKGASQFKGVYFQDGRWVASIRVPDGVARPGGRGRRVYLGRFSSEEEAAKAYDSAAIEHFGQFARTNLSHAA